MMLTQRGLGKVAGARPALLAGNAASTSRKVACNAADTATAWASWDTYMSKRKPVIKAGEKENSVYSAIGEAISKSSTTYKAKYTATSSYHGDAPVYKPVKKNVSALSRDLHEKLEAVGIETLKTALKLSDTSNLEAAGTSFTTTDVNAAICVTGAIVQKGSDKNAVVAFVVTETERAASWSRLEGLLLHWACSASAGSAWSMPPAGWTALLPNKTSDAGGAMQCGFEKHTEGQQQFYVLVMSLPLSGVLRTGGLSFVLKACDAQNTKWLKDATTDENFFVDVHSLPFSKI